MPYGLLKTLHEISRAQLQFLRWRNCAIYDVRKNMATYHCSVKSGKSGKAAAHASYICREDKYEKMKARAEGEKLVYVEHGNMPKWAQNRPATFWEMSDAHERKNGAVYREAEVALPREHTDEQNIALVRDFLHRLHKDSHAYTFALHTPKAALDGGEQKHAHIMWSDRIIDSYDRDPEMYFKRANKKDPEKGGCVKEHGGSKDRLLALRKLWEVTQNEHLQQNGFNTFVDCRSLKDQGITREPEQKLGPTRISNMGPEEIADFLQIRKNEKTLDLAQKYEALVLKRKIDRSSFSQSIKESESAPDFSLNIEASKASFKEKLAANRALQAQEQARAQEAAQEAARIALEAAKAAEREVNSLPAPILYEDEVYNRRSRDRGMER